MGGSCSSLSNIGSSEYLRRLCGAEVICENDPFWNALLSFSLVDLDLVAQDSGNSKLLDDIAASFCKNLAINNTKTGNFHTLIVYFMHRLDGVIQIGVSDEATNPFTWQVLNALFIIRVVCKHYVQNLSEEVIIQQFLKPAHDPSETSDDKFMSGFLSSLTHGLAKIPIHETTVLLHLEMVNCLLTLLAMSMYDANSSVNNSLYIELMQGDASNDAAYLTKVLLTAFAYSDKIPSFVYREEDTDSSLSSTLWSVMTLGLGGKAAHSVRKVNLGTQSVLLLLVLTIHPCQDNPYKKAIEDLSSDHDSPSHVKPEVITLCKHFT